MVCRLLATVMQLQSLTIEGTMTIIQYHLQRNLIAYKSHRKKRVFEAMESKARGSIHKMGTKLIL